MNTRRFRSGLLGLALGVLLVLLAAPPTRWLVREQVTATGLSFHTPAALVRGADEARRRAVAAHPDDLPLQMAAPQGAGGSRRLAAYLRTLLPRFPHSPALYANLLRYETGSPQDNGSVFLVRPVEEEYLSGHPQLAARETAPPPDPAALAAFDADAAAGERLDPENAFFPMMRAVGLFAARRDRAATDALLRAGREPVWREYMQDEINGRLRLADAAYGHGSALSRIAIMAGVLYPHYSALRGLARVAVAQAAQAERAGQTERGLAIRRAVMHCGGLMRADSSTYIGSLVGIAVAAIATSRPGGAPPLAAPPGHTVAPEERAERRLRAFQDYARRIGHPDDADRARAERAAGDTVRTLWIKAEDRSPLSNARLARLGAWWAGDLLTLANAFWLLVLGVAGAGLARLPSWKEEKPLSRPTLWGLAAALITAALLALVVFSDYEAENGVALVGALVLAPIVGLLLIRLRRASPQDHVVWRRNAGRSIRAFGLTGLALLALGVIAAGQTRGVLGYAASLQEVMGQSGGDAAAAAPQAQETEVVVVLGSLVLPLLLTIVLSIAGCVRRVPVSVALVQGFRTGGPSLACVLLVVYGALVLGTLRQERAMQDGLARMVQHEGRYFASLAGQDWPGFPAGREK